MALASPPKIELSPGHQLTADQRRAIIALCEAVFAEDLSTLFESLGDSMHLLIWVSDALLGHACWVDCGYRPTWLPPCERPT